MIAMGPGLRLLLLRFPRIIVVGLSSFFFHVSVGVDEIYLRFIRRRAIGQWDMPKRRDGGAVAVAVVVMRRCGSQQHGLGDGVHHLIDGRRRRSTHTIAFRVSSCDSSHRRTLRLTWLAVGGDRMDFLAPTHSVCLHGERN